MIALFTFTVYTPSSAFWMTRPGSECLSKIMLGSGIRSCFAGGYRDRQELPDVLPDLAAASSTASAI